MVNGMREIEGIRGEMESDAKEVKDEF